jgi:hypothetical protein
MKYIINILIVLLLISCDIFETRDAQSPDQSGSDYTPAIQPQTLINNLMNSFKDKDVVNYRNSFITSNSIKEFVFLPSSSSSIRFPGIWDDWDIDSEVAYFNSMKSSVSPDLPVTLVLSTSLESFIFTGDSLRYFSDYSISIPQADGNILHFAGNLEFRMLNINSWMIYYWKDNAIEDKQSWSDLKGSNN